MQSIMNFLKTKNSTHQMEKNNSEKEIPHATTLIHINQYNTHTQNFEKKLEMLLNIKN